MYGSRPLSCQRWEWGDKSSWARWRAVRCTLGRSPPKCFQGCRRRPPPKSSMYKDQVDCTLLSWDVTKSQEMLQNLWQCQVTTWTIVHSYAKNCTCKPPSNWETRDSPFIRGVPSLKKPSLQCCQTIKQIYNRLPIHSSKHSFSPFIHKSWWKL